MISIVEVCKSVVDLAVDTVGNVERTGLCCDEAYPSRCVAFNLILNPNAIGLMIEICGCGGPNNICPCDNWVTQGQQTAGEWKIGCDTVQWNDHVICLNGETFFTLTHCKPGANNLHYRFSTIAGAVVAGASDTRIECGKILSVSNITDPVWNSISPGPPGYYNGFLSDTSSYNPIFDPVPPPDIPDPPYISYEVCGKYTADTTACYGGIDCDTVTIYVHPAITFALDTTYFCEC